MIPREQAEIDLAAPEHLLGCKARIVMNGGIVGNITQIIYNPGNRVYVLQWMDGDSLQSVGFYGFQLELED